MPSLHLSQAPGGAEAESGTLVQLIDEHGAYSTARLVPDGSVEERSEKRGPGLLGAGSEGWEGLARPRRFSCAACGKAFKRAWELLSHEVVHTVARPFRCGLCAAAFKRHSDCKSHRLVHSDERPHGCDACGKRFKRASNLQVRSAGRGQRRRGLQKRGRAERGWVRCPEMGGACRKGRGRVLNQMLFSCSSRLTLRLHGVQHARLPRPSLSSGVCSNLRPLSPGTLKFFAQGALRLLPGLSPDPPSPGALCPPLAGITL